MADAIAAFTEETDDESSESPHAQQSLKEEQSSEDEQFPSPKPLKSILKRRPADESVYSETRPATKRSISFAPGLVTGKSDVPEIAEDAVRTRSSKSSNSSDSSQSTVADDDPISSDSQSLDFTNWKFGSSFSASETSDDEKDFEKLRRKYSEWDGAQVAVKDRKERLEAKAKQTVERLKEQRKKVDGMKKEIGHIVDEYGPREGTNEMLESSYKIWKKKQNKKGVIYISSIPFGCTHQSLFKIFEEFGKVTNVYLEAQLDKKTGQKKMLHDHHAIYSEAWIEFKERKVAKQVVSLLNETELPKKYSRKGSAARGHIWKMKYLKGFGWHHLKEYTDTVKTLQQKKYEIKIADAQRQASYFAEQVRKAKEMTGRWGPRSTWGRQTQAQQHETYGPSGGTDITVADEAGLGKEPPRKRPKWEVEQRTTPYFQKPYISHQMIRRLKK